MKGERFEWDEAKNERNIRKHGFDFADVKYVFDETVLVKRDNRKLYGEIRWIALGDLHGTVVVVAYTHRGERVRIISMRKGTEHERKEYRKKTRKG